MMGYIYKVTNIINNKIYIGQTIKSVTTRWKEHCQRSLKNSKCHFHLAIKKYGIKNFLVEELIKVNATTTSELKFKLDLLERSYIHFYNSYNSGYNSTIGGDNGVIGLKMSKETRQKMSEIRLGRKYKQFNPQTQEFEYLYSSKKAAYINPILQYDLNGNFIKEWINITSAADYLNIDSGVIYRACKRNGSSHNYQWRYKTKNYEYKIESYYNPKSIQILQYDKYGNLVKEWNSILEICNTLGYDRRHFYSALNKKKIYKNFNWIRKYVK